jgi:hypothetical protein
LFEVTLPPYIDYIGGTFGRIFFLIFHGVRLVANFFFFFSVGTIGRDIFFFFLGGYDWSWTIWSRIIFFFLGGYDWLRFFFLYFSAAGGNESRWQKLRQNEIQKILTTWCDSIDARLRSLSFESGIRIS